MRAWHNTRQDEYTSGITEGNDNDEEDDDDSDGADRPPPPQGQDAESGLASSTHAAPSRRWVAQAYLKLFWQDPSSAHSMPGSGVSFAGGPTELASASTPLRPPREEEEEEEEEDEEDGDGEEEEEEGSNGGAGGVLAVAAVSTMTAESESAAAEPAAVGVRGQGRGLGRLFRWFGGGASSLGETSGTGAGGSSAEVFSSYSSSASSTR